MLLPRRECAEDYSLRTIARCTLIIGGLIAWTLFAGVLIGVCSAASPDTVFEVASVKRAAPLPQQQLFLRELTWEYMDPGFHLVHGRTLRLGSITLPQLIARAYRVRTRQVIVPKGFNSEKYDIEARLPEGAPKDGEYEMLKNLLADRFALRVHAETRNESGLQLVVRAGGSHLKAADPATKRKEGDVESLLARKREPMARGAGYFQSGHCSMAKLADYLSLTLKMLIADHTGLSGEYEVALDIAPQEDADGLDRPARFVQALRKLGLDLKKGEVALDVVVVDSASRTPTPN
jgi:uncharacterized protein (TIGR03435 family)